MLSRTILLMAAIVSVFAIPSPGPVGTLPGYGKPPTTQIAGHVTVFHNETCSANLFFWLVESAGDPAVDPVVIWLNGGPGSSSLLGFFAENGPFHINSDGTKLTDNRYGWNHNATYIAFDQPAGTGLSFVTADACYAQTEDAAMDQLYDGVLQVLTNWPKYRRLPLFVFGESYGGKFIPELATRIVDGNAKLEDPLNFRGIGIGDGWVDPYVQQSTYGAYAYAQGLIDDTQRDYVDQLYTACAAAINASMPVPSREADRVCNRIEEYIGNVSGGVNVDDVRQFSQDDFSFIGTYLNNSDVLAALHVDPSVPGWVSDSDIVAFLLERGEQGSAAGLYPALLERVGVLVYNGLYDMDCNFMGTDLWLRKMSWSGQAEWATTPRQPWTVDGKIAGHIRSVANLTQLLLQGAGHLAPMDQPVTTLRMLNDFLEAYT